LKKSVINLKYLLILILILILIE